MLRTALRACLLALFVGLVLEATLVMHDGYKHFSRASAYRRLAIGLSRAQAVEVLREEEIWCGVNEPAYPGEVRSNTCRFSDFWRNYSVTIDDATGTISTRAYIRRRKVLLLRLFGE